ncbi:MAG: ABC transporter substrate-binding protein, partial [Achromobacter sp.]|nr:ABC transporter substrate-binding protein [Achromobacter sp.]
MLAKSRLAAACAAAFAIAAGSAYAQTVPAGYPADYQKILDGAKKEGKVVIYST